MLTLDYADVNDNYIESNSSSYSTALAGNNLTLGGPGSTQAIVGQWRDTQANLYRIYQYFLEFNYSTLSGSVPVTGFLAVLSDKTTGTSQSRNLEVYEYDWGASVDTSDWRTNNYIRDNLSPSLAYLQSAHNTSSTKATYWGVQRADNLDTSRTLRLVMTTNRNRLAQPPSGEERHFLRTADEEGTSLDPTFAVMWVKEHLLNRTLGGQVQLSDGSNVFMTMDEVSGTSLGLNVWHREPEGTPTLLFRYGVVNQDYRGAQAFAITRDENDNFYIFHGAPDVRDNIRGRAYLKGPGNTWSEGVLRTFSMPDEDDQAMLVSVGLAYHQVGSGGTLVVTGFRNWGRMDEGAQDPYLLINAGYMRTGSGTAVRAVGRMGDVGLTAFPSPLGYKSFVNQTGTLHDISAEPGLGRRGHIMNAERNTLANLGGQSIGRYELNSSGTGFSRVRSYIDGFSGLSVKDADAKSRVLPINENRFCTVNVSTSSNFGIVVKHRESADIETLTVLGDVRLDAENIASMPDPFELYNSSAWDACYNPVDNSVWVYYFDTNDTNRLMRTQVDLNTNTAVRNEFEVNNSVGASGSTNHAIRVHRGPTSSRSILVSVANEDSGGSHSVIYIDDFLNAIPTQPTLTPKSNFDADEDAVFEWTFSDPDPNDSQSAYELEIYNNSTGASAVDTGKVLSSNNSHTVSGGELSNDEEYRWRVRVWDSRDDVSPWSDFGTFQTSNTGAVTIIDPSVDNDPAVLTANYTIEWEVTGTTQDQYEVVVTRVSDGSILVDTGLVSSTDTTYTIENMLSDVQYLVEVTVYSSGVASNTAERLITPDYNSPEIPVPTITTVTEGGYIQVTINNPEPQGDRPNPDYNEVYRRPADSDEDFLLIGTSDPNTNFRDYTAASGVVYEYFVRAGVE